MKRMNEMRRVLPDFLVREIESILSSRVGGGSGFSELRLSAEGRCSMVHNGDSLTLMSRLTRCDIEEIFVKASHGSVYAHRETVGEGYIAMDGGIRLGLSGRARYDKGDLVGVSDIGSLIFRIPLDFCDFEERIISLTSKQLKKGILIYSPPGVGKTTALRTIARYASKKMRLCIIDERGELATDQAPDAVVLSGYKKAEGIEIATRTHSPELLMIDEICHRDTETLLATLGCGVPILATTHAGSLEELVSKRSIQPLIDGGVFGIFIEISRKNKKYRLKKYTVSDIRKMESRKREEGREKLKREDISESEKAQTLESGFSHENYKEDKSAEPLLL